MKASPAWSPDGKRIAFQGNMEAAPYNYKIYTIAPDGSALKRLTSSDRYDGDPAWSPDSASLAFASNRDGPFHVFVMHADGTGLTRLTTSAASEFNPSWAPDGRRIVFSATPAQGQDRQDLYVVSVDGTTASRVTVGTGAWPRWHPAGNAVVFTSRREGNSDLFLVTLPPELSPAQSMTRSMGR